MQPPGKAPSKAENSPAMATGYLAGTVVPLCWPLEQLLGGTAWASWQFCGDAQDRDALGWESVLQPSQLSDGQRAGFALYLSVARLS